jgi:hypothetical protein
MHRIQPGPLGSQDFVDVFDTPEPPLSLADRMYSGSLPPRRVWMKMNSFIIADGDNTYEHVVNRCVHCGTWWRYRTERTERVGR